MKLLESTQVLVSWIQGKFIPALPFYGFEASAPIPELKDLAEPQTIGQHIRKRRIQLRMKQARLANEFGISEDTLTAWENERNIPQIHFYPKLISFLGYNPFSLDTKSIGGQIYRYRTENGLSHRKLSRITG